MSLRLLRIIVTLLCVVFKTNAQNNDNQLCGIQSSENEYPWLVNFEFEYKTEPKLRSLCSGALIGESHAIGKAECFGAGRNFLAKYVRLGPYDENTEGHCAEGSTNCTGNGVIRVPIETVIQHSVHLPLFTFPINTHSVALVVLREVVPYTDTIRPICLPSADITQSTATYWELYHTGTSQPLTYIPRKHQTPTYYVDRTFCRDARLPQFWLEDDICVNDADEINACLMRGSLLMNKRGDSYELIGLSEVTEYCNSTARIFTNFFLHVDWVRNKIPEWTLGSGNPIFKDETATRPKAATCGRRRVEYIELVTNGKPTKVGDWPWHVAVYRLKKSVFTYICGGTLISKSTVLTAAHCATINGIPAAGKLFSIFLGKYNLLGDNSEAQERLVQSVIVHKDFAPNNYLENDIALLKLKTDATYNNFVQPACWSTEAYDRLHSNKISGTVVGWGFDQTRSLESRLKQANLPMISEVSCMQKNPLFYVNALNDKKFCAGWANGTSPCNGDSGGGYLVFVPDSDSTDSSLGSWYVRGVVSITLSLKKIARCDPNQYTVFTDVAKHIDWIKSHLVNETAEVSDDM